ncbi:MAG TPA: phage tail sheath C-terminal domain-containing protein [Allosphingosinicella sp.]|jgi:hypothetical protein
MPVHLTYPGVYIEELASGERMITPVATSIAAFVGRAPMGPVDEPLMISSYGDFTRRYGGLTFDYPLSYAVKDFFDNGGSEALLARLFEPVVGDGAARLNFAGAEPMLPEHWLVFAGAAKGAAQIQVSPPDDKSEGEPDVGMKLYLNGDTSQTYVVTGFTPANPAKKIAASVTIAPPLARAFRKCTPLAFAHGPAPSGWSVDSVSGNAVTLTKGTGLPELGQRLVFAKDPTVYTIIAEPVVKGTDPEALQVTLTVTPKPGVVLGSVSISDPVALPMPTDWEIESFDPGTAVSTGTLSLIQGVGEARPGDLFSIGDDPDLYVVTGFRPADAKNPAASLTFASLTGDPVDPEAFCLCCAPSFQRVPPQNMSIKSGGKSGSNSFTYGTGPASSGTVDIGDSFTVDGDATEYVVRYVDANNVVYFLPEAKLDFKPTSALTFAPPLSLVAANPGRWGNRLVAKADTKGINDLTAKPFKEYGLEAADLFNLTLTLNDARGRPISSERYLNLSVKADGKEPYPNRIDRVLHAQSNLARVDRLSAIPPGDGGAAQGIGGDDGGYLSTPTYLGDAGRKTGIYLLNKADIFNLLSIPPDRRIFADVPESEQDLDQVVCQAAAQLCTDRRAFYIVDPPVAWKNKAVQGLLSQIDPQDVGISGENRDGMEVARNAAVYFPRLWKEDILMKSQLALFAPSGAVAGVMAATDVGRGVWKAPAGVDAGLANVRKLEVSLNDDEHGQLNPIGINCLRTFPIIGPVVWGSRTLRGADQFEDDYKYVSVRRLTLFIEETLKRGTEWAVHEPNDEALWSSLRLSVNTFLAGLARQGALYSYHVKCDGETTTQDMIAAGIVNIVVNIAPVKPAEFVVLQIQQTAGTAAA